VKIPKGEHARIMTVIADYKSMNNNMGRKKIKS